MKRSEAERQGLFITKARTADGNEEEFVCTVPGLEMRLQDNQLTFEAPGEEVINRCEHCGRGDWVPRVAHGWEAAVERGWLVRIEDEEAGG